MAAAINVGSCRVLTESLSKIWHGLRRSSTLPERIVDMHRSSVLNKVTREEAEERKTDSSQTEALRQYRHVYPEFLPDTTWYYRDRVREKLERQDMMKRRARVEIPEFYVGSTLAVMSSNPNADKGRTRFVGLCIQRDGVGLRHFFTLRNVIGDQGVEVMYELYNPTILEIQVLKLEKRLDEHLLYLRDAPAEYSTVPFDTVPVPHAKGATVPVNPIKVKLGPRPWHERWERQELQGVDDLGLPERFYERAREIAKPWEKYDLMKQYREKITVDEDLDVIYSDVHEKNKEIERQKLLKLQRLKPSRDKDGGQPAR